MVYKPIADNHDEIPQIKKAILKQPETAQEKPAEIYEVVFKLPTQEIRKYRKEDGTIVNLITVEEYLTEQANARLQ